MNTMNILLLEPGKRPRSAVITGTLQSMQQVVDGPIQAVYPFAEPVALICNEEGKLRNLPWNRALRDEAGQIYDIVAGRHPGGEYRLPGAHNAASRRTTRPSGVGMNHSSAANRRAKISIWVFVKPAKESSPGGAAQRKHVPATIS